MASKDELETRTGVAGASKQELEATAADQRAAGPFVDDEDTFESKGRPTKGVQAQTADEIPEAGR